MQEKQFYPYRSLFWPVVLIGFGVIMLLANLDLIPMPSLRMLLRLWPLALIVLGLDILVGRRSPLIGALIGLGAVALVILLFFSTSVLDVVPSVERKTIPLTTPLGNTSSAEVTLDLERYPSTIDSSVNSDELFDAVLETYTDVDYSVRGDQRKTIDLKPVDSSAFDLDWTFTLPRDMTWEIGLSPEIPLDLTIDVGSGSASLDLANLMLDELYVDGGSGSTDLLIPAGQAIYPVDVNGGSITCSSRGAGAASWLYWEETLFGRVRPGLSGLSSTRMWSGLPSRRLAVESGAGFSRVRVPCPALRRNGPDCSG